MTYQPKNTVFTKIAKRLRVVQNVNRLKLNLDRPIVSVTFDDFPRSALTVGGRMLEKQGWAGTYYTCANFSNGKNHHGEMYHRSDLIPLQDAGHEIGGHTLDHLDCTTLTLKELMDQIEENSRLLRHFGVRDDIESFAFPFGQANADLKLLLNGQFKSLRGISNGQHVKSADLNELKSYGFYSSTAARVIKAVDDLKNRPAWLTLFTHDIQDNPTQWGCTPGDFAALITALKRSGAQVLPVREAIKTIEATHD